MGGGSCLRVAGSLHCKAGTNTCCEQLCSNEGNLFTMLSMNEVSCSVFSLVTTLADGRPCRFTSISIPVLQEHMPHEWNLLTHQGTSHSLFRGSPASAACESHVIADIRGKVLLPSSAHSPEQCPISSTNKSCLQSHKFKEHC